MSKSDITRQQILAQALKSASISSLNEITIGGLAHSIGMSKSGVYAHFNSKENLQIAIIDLAANHFIDRVIQPLENIDDAFQRLQALPDLWPGWYEGVANNCLYLSAAFEFDDQPGVVQDHIRYHLEQWLAYLSKLIETLIHEGIFHPTTDAIQFAYELYSLYLGSQFFKWLSLEDKQRSRFRHSFDCMMKLHLVKLN